MISNETLEMGKHKTKQEPNIEQFKVSSNR